MHLIMKVALLSCLYIAQGLPFGFFTQALPVLMRKMNFSLADIGLTSMLALPWAAKFLWASWVDRYGSERFGKRKSWLIPLQSAMTLLLLLLAFWSDENNLQFLWIAVFLTNLLAATQDIATDGLAVEILSEHERGLGNSIQVAAYRIGMILGGGAILLVFDAFGWSVAFLSMSVLLVLTSIPILFFNEAKYRAAHDKQEKNHTNPVNHEQKTLKNQGTMLQRLAVPKLVPFLVLLSLYKFGDALASAMVRPFFIDQGLTMSDIGIWLGTYGFIAGFIGALLGGWCAQHWGRRKAILFCGLLQTASILFYALASWQGISTLGLQSDNIHNILLSGAIIEHICGGMATVSLFTLMMDTCDPEYAGTDYTIQASTVVLSTGIASAMSGMIAGAWGYMPLFLLATLLSALGCIFFIVGLDAGILPARTEKVWNPQYKAKKEQQVQQETENRLFRQILAFTQKDKSDS